MLKKSLKSLKNNFILVIFLLLFKPNINANNNTENIYVELIINNKKNDGIFNFIKIDNDYWLLKSSLKDLPFVNFKTQNRIFEDEEYILLPKEIGISFDSLSSTLSLNTPLELLKTNTVSKEKHGYDLTATTFAAYWNYSLHAHQEKFYKSSFSPIKLSTHHQIAILPKYGALFNTFMSTHGVINKIIRLDNFYIIDFYKKYLRLTLGDSTTEENPAYSSKMRFLGVKLQKSYFFNKEIATYPSIDLKGELQTDGTLEVKVEDVLAFKKKADMGLFVIDDLKLPIGSHKGELIITDANGDIRRVAFTYHADPQMLKPGLSTFSYSLGSIRQDYGYKNFSYGDIHASINQTIGITNNWTASAHSLFTHKYLLAGLENRLKLFASNMLFFHTAVQAKKATPLPYAYGVGFSSKILKFNLNSKFNYFSSLYAPLGSNIKDAQEKRYSITSYLSFDYDFLKSTSFLHNFSKKESGIEHILSINQNFSIYDLAFNAGSSYDFRSNNFTIYGFLSYSFASNQSLSAMAEYKNKSLSSYVGYQGRFENKQHKFLTSLSGNFASNITGKTLIGYENNYLQTRTFLDINHQGFSYTAQASSAFGLIGTKPFIAKNINQSMALIQVPQIEGIRVLKERSFFLGTTDKNGYFLINNLIPYQTYKFSFDTNSLDPLLATEYLNKDIIINPGFSTVHLLKIKSQKIKRIILTPLLDDKILLEGTRIIFTDLEQEVFVNSSGQIYLEVAEEQTFIKGMDEENQCLLEISLNENKDEEIIIDLGNKKCQKP